VGEQGHARGVPPLVRLVQIGIAVDEKAPAMRLLHANFNQRCRLLSTRIGRRSLQPDKRDAVGDVVNRRTVA
jgi:hypothetical protein